MAAVSEWVVREYFEMLGYFVMQPRKYTVPGRAKTADEEVDLVVCNPCVGGNTRPDHVVWLTEDLRGIARAIVGVRGWHTERFSASRLEQTPDILRFAEPRSVRFAAELLGSDDMVRILCMPRLPASGQLKEQTIAALREKGVDGVISFSTILREIIARVDRNRHYEKSDMLQVIRLLKSYDLLREDQLDLFQKKRARRPRRAAPAPAGT